MTSFLTLAQLALIIVVVVVTFVAVTTHVVGRLVDKKIGDIRVNVPKIRVQPPNVVIRMNPQMFPAAPQAPGKAAKPKRPSEKLTHPNKIQLYEPFLSVDFDEKTGPDQDDSSSLTRAIVVDTSTPPTQPRIAVGCVRDADCNVVNGGGQNVCKTDGTCHCVGGGSGLFCHYGPVNYRDPKDMSEAERYRFKSKYRGNMTLQDYKNWLMLYKPDPSQLNEDHRRNLLALMQGGQITTKDVPAVRLRAPTSASDYFQRMYKDGNIAVNFPEQDGPYVGANYGQYDSFEPPDNTAGSNSITGIVNAYKADGKDDARAVDWYVRPPVTVGEDEQRAGDIYQQYIRQQHTLADMRGTMPSINRQNGLTTFSVDETQEEY